MHRGQTVSSHKVRKCCCECVRVNRFAVPPCKHKVIFHSFPALNLYSLRPLVAYLEPLRFLNTLPIFQKLNAVCTNTDIAMAFL